MTDSAVLCWNAEGAPDRRARAIAAFLGAQATPVVLTDVALRESESLNNLIPECECLIAHAEVLSRAAEAMPGGAGGLCNLLRAAKRIFIYGFRPGADSSGAMLQALSGGALAGVKPLANPGAEFQVAPSHRDLCRQLSGLSLGAADRSRESAFIPNSALRQDDVIIQAAGEPLFVRLEQRESQLFFCACSDLADLDETVYRRHRFSSWFLGLAPLIMFLRAALGNRLWHNDSPRACLIIDDPLLKPRYGCLEYSRLLDSLRRQKAASCLAFIPWNYRRSNRKTAALFSANSSLLSLCVHGCDHTAGEFADTGFERLRGKAELALERMREHCRLTGVRFDDVMVFPQGLFSAEAVAALKASGYLAAVNGSTCPSTEPGSLSLRDLLEVAVTKFANFPVFGRRYPRDLPEIALDLFLGKPALVAEHHGYFQSGYEALDAFIEKLNSVETRLEWTNPATICSQACLTREAAADEIHVRFFTNRFRLTNDGGQTRPYVLFRPQADGPLPPVAVDGRAWPRERQDGSVAIHLSLAPGQSAGVVVSTGGPEAAASPRRLETGKTRVWLRRVLSECRDNYVHTNPLLRHIASTAPQSFSH